MHAHIPVAGWARPGKPPGLILKSDWSLKAQCLWLKVQQKEIIDTDGHTRERNRWTQAQSDRLTDRAANSQQVSYRSFFQSPRRWLMVSLQSCLSLKAIVLRFISFCGILDDNIVSPPDEFVSDFSTCSKTSLPLHEAQSELCPWGEVSFKKPLNGTNKILKFKSLLPSVSQECLLLLAY